MTIIGYFYRQYVEDNPSSMSIAGVDDDEVMMQSKGRHSLLTARQTTWQKQLLSRYGNTVMPDATYRTAKYSVLLLFLCVRSSNECGLRRCRRVRIAVRRYCKHYRGTSVVQVMEYTLETGMLYGRLQ
jgi:hypothetical protein